MHLVPQNSCHSTFEYLNYQDFIILIYSTSKYTAETINSLNIDYMFIIHGLKLQRGGSFLQLRVPMPADANGRLRWQVWIRSPDEVLRLLSLAALCPDGLLTERRSSLVDGLPDFKLHLYEHWARSLS